MGITILSSSSSIKDSPHRAAATSDDNAHLAPVKFYDALPRLLRRRNLTIEDICPSDDFVARRALEEYGALFIAHESVQIPPACVFQNEQAVNDFQTRIKITSALIDGVNIELQFAALESLLAARHEAHAENLCITPRDGAEAARRRYVDTLRLWDSRIYPALDYWCACGSLSVEDANTLRDMNTSEQIKRVLELEASGIFFSKDFTKSVMRSVALPGTSQHLSMLAFDVTEFRNMNVRAMLARHGWFQTVLSDMPHFTFLGRDERELPACGLKSVTLAEQVFWIPNV